MAKDICPWLRWSEARPVLRRSDSQSPVETLLSCSAKMAEALLHLTAGMGPGIGSLEPSRATILGKEF